MNKIKPKIVFSNNQETLYLAESAKLLKIKPKALQNWFHKKLVPLHSKQSGWRRFSCWDVIHLNIVKTLSEHGIPLIDAGELSYEIMCKFIYECNALHNNCLAEIAKNNIVFFNESGKYNYKIVSDNTQQFLVLDLPASSCIIIKMKYLLENLQITECH